eukprot:13902636-Ditylum_brightwellii.AAC.1
MDNLAFTATTSNNVLEQLTKNNTKLTTQLCDVMKVIKQLQDENTKLLKIIELSVSSGTGTGGGKLLPWSNCIKSNRKSIDYDKTDHQIDPEGYCWSCEYHVQKNHNSMNCDKQKTGHQLGATWANIIGGNKYHHWWTPK